MHDKLSKQVSCQLRRPNILLIAVGFALLPAARSEAAEPADIVELRAQLESQRADLAGQKAALEEQRREIARQQYRLDSLSAQILSAQRGMGIDGQTSAVPSSAEQVAQRDTGPPPAGVEHVGEAPEEARQPPQIAVLGDQGGIITKRGRITFEPSFEYTHADRNRALFRGVQVVEAVLIGVFDINETRQDVLTASLGGRYGITDRFEFGVKVPFIHRADRTVLAPVAGANSSSSDTAVQDFPAKASNVGDVEATFRYQINDGRGGWPFLIANIQTVIPTGTNPFSVRRDVSGAPTEAATGSGFWGVSPTLTAILPTDPAVLFATVGYSRNFGRGENSRIGSSQVDYVKPGDALLATVGLGVSLNERTSFNVGYAHSWAFGTRTVMRVEQTAGPGQAAVLSPPINTLSRDLQLGRYLLGVSYRVNDRTTINWAIEVGATSDAPSIHTSLRIPITF